MSNGNGNQPTNAELLKAIKKLEKEMVDAHNMSIKTDTSIHNLYAELKRIAENHERAVKSAKLQSATAYILFVLLVVVGAFLVVRYYVAAQQAKFAQVLEELESAKQELASFRKAEQERKAAEVQAWNLLQALHDGNEKEALKLHSTLNRRRLGKTLLAVLDSEVEQIKLKMAKRALKEGMRLYRVGNYTNAIRELKPIVDMKLNFEGHATALYYIGFSYFNLRKYKDALAAFEEALNRAPDADEAPRARYLLGLCMEYGGNKEEALRYFQDLLTRPGKNPYRQRIRERIIAIKKDLGLYKPRPKPQPENQQPLQQGQ